MFLLLLFFLLYNIVLVLPYINMHPPQVYTCSPFWTPLQPPAHVFQQEKPPEWEAHPQQLVTHSPRN